MNDLLLPKCPKCNNDLFVMSYYDPGINNMCFIIQCPNMCYNVKFKDYKRDDAISKFMATVNYLEKVNAPY